MCVCVCVGVRQRASILIDGLIKSSFLCSEHCFDCVYTAVLRPKKCTHISKNVCECATVCECLSMCVRCMLRCVRVCVFVETEKRAEMRDERVLCAHCSVTKWERNGTAGLKK